MLLHNFLVLVMAAAVTVTTLSSPGNHVGRNQQISVVKPVLSQLNDESDSTNLLEALLAKTDADRNSGQAMPRREAERGRTPPMASRRIQSH
jgi:hypothetical protein